MALSLKELEASLREMLRNGTPTSIEPLQEHPLKGKLWRDVNSQRLFCVREVEELTLVVREYYEPHLYCDPRLQPLPPHEDHNYNRWVFESDVESEELVEVLVPGLNAS